MKSKISLLIILFLSSLSIETFAQQRGIASYYANRFHGRKTTSGLVYDKDSLTCAHKTLPFGTLLKVKNLRNNKEVIVKVTDRGPHTRNRLLDLSYAAAKKIDMVASGMTQVEFVKWEPKSIPLIKPTKPLNLKFLDRYIQIMNRNQDLYSSLVIDKKNVSDN